MTEGAVRLRPARREDCRTIAQLYSISSDGVAEYAWTQLAEPGEDIFEVGRRRYEREDSAFGYRSCTLATCDGETVGMLVAFPAPAESDPPPEATDPVMAPYARLEERGSYYVCGVAVFPAHRGEGLGTRFMTLAEDKAREAGYSRLSLIVFEQNTGARRLYERLGYREVARAAVVPHPLIRYEGDALLMVKDLG